MLTKEDKDALRVMREEMEEKLRAEAREAGKLNHKGKVIDQTEICYKQYAPPQVENVQNLGNICL